MSTKLSVIDSELLQCHSKMQRSILGKVLSVLQDIETRNRGPPCSQCFGPAADCVCVEKRPRCGGCDHWTQCVCLYGGGCGRKRKCSACTGCSSRASENARGLGELVDSILSVRNVAPIAHPTMVDIIDTLLKAVDGRSSLRVERVRVALAHKMLRCMMAKVCPLLARLRDLSPSDADWGRAFVLIHDIRDVFVHSRVPAMVIHRDFGRLCNAVCDALAVPEPEVWLRLSPAERPAALCALFRAAGRSLAGVDASFLGEWGRRLVERAVGG